MAERIGLVLSRKVNEQIVIGEGADQIVITLCEAQPGKARIGINAPPTVKVHRREVYEAIKANPKPGA